MERIDEFNQSSQNFRKSIVEINENFAKTNLITQDIENFINDLHINFQEEMVNIYSIYLNIKEVIDNLLIEFPMIDIKSNNQF